jgi:predicted permease
MRSLRAWMIRIAGVIRSRGQDGAFDEELQTNLALHVEENMRAGMSPAAAKRDARRKLGGLDAVAESHRDRRRLPWVDQLLQDVRYGIRGMVKSPGLTLAAIAVLAVGLAANILIFGIANASLFKPLPIHDPDRVVRIYFEPSVDMKAAGAEMDRNRRYADIREYRDRTQSMSAVAAFTVVGVLDAPTLGLRVGNETFPVAGGVVSGNYFDTLGLAATVGRMLRPADDVPGGPGVAVISDALWRGRFAGDPNVIGRSILLNGRAFTVVGVAPRDFIGTYFVPLAVQVWVPLSAPGFAPTPEQIARHEGWPLSLIGRLKPGVDVAQAQAEFSTLEAQLAVEHPDGSHGKSAFVYPARTFGPELTQAVAAFTGLMLGLVGLLLVIACVNIASLLLARSTARQQEISIRRALGASRGRLIRQLLCEAWLLSIAACAAAYLLGTIVIRVVPSSVWLSPTNVLASLSVDYSFDWRVLAFSAGLILITTVACGLAPALQSSKHAATEALKGRATTVGQSRSRLRTALMTGQVAMATLLLVVAGLATRGLLRAYALDLGFRAEHLFTTTIDVGARGYDAERGRRLYDQLVGRVERLPGASAASLANILPMTMTSSWASVIRDGDPPPDPRRAPPSVDVNTISRGHFATLGIPRLAGRDFGDGDAATAPPVAIVNETLARRFFPGESPIGKRLRIVKSGQPGRAVEVVGLVRDSTYMAVNEGAKSFVYLPVAQAYESRMNLLVRVPDGRDETLQAVRGEIQALDPDLALSPMQPFDVSSSLLLNRVAAMLAGAAGVIALGLAAIGLFGVITFLVQQRTKEIGIRIALGARRAAVVLMIVRQGARWTVTGLGFGLAASALVAPLLGAQLYGVRAGDPVVYAAVPVVLLCISLAACAMPGWRASRIDPMVALREE